MLSRARMMSFGQPDKELIIKKTSGGQRQHLLQQIRPMDCNLSVFVNKNTLH